jgi:hypothetical protein
MPHEEKRRRTLLSQILVVDEELTDRSPNTKKPPSY